MQTFSIWSLLRNAMPYHEGWQRQMVTASKDCIGKRSLSRRDTARPDRKQLVGLLPVTRPLDRARPREGWHAAHGGACARRDARRPHDDRHDHDTPRVERLVRSSLQGYVQWLVERAGASCGGA